MIRISRKAEYFLLFLVFALILGAGAGRAWAYVTTYAEAAGTVTLHMGDETTIEEEFSNWEKRVTITSDADSEPVYIRAKAFGSGSYPLVYSGDGWSAGEGDYYYYNDIVPGGKATNPLSVKIEHVPADDVEDGTAFNVIVIYESTPVLYREDGTPYADWDIVLDNGTSETGGSAQKGGE